MTNESSWETHWIRGSRIEEITWIGEHVLAWSTGQHLVFVDVARRTETLHRCSNDVTGNGACCISGHSSLPVFAFSEKIRNPRILILAYPTLKTISECVKGSENGYVTTAFTRKEHFVSLGSYPDFLLIVWRWKNGEKLMATNTALRDDIGQSVTVRQVGRTLFAQFGRTCGRLFTWELDVAGSVIVLKDHEIRLPEHSPIYWADWSPLSDDPLLAITDINGHIYLSNHDGTNIHRIVLSQRCGICLDIEIPTITWFRGGIILRTTFCQLRYYTKNSRTGTWHREWHVKSTMRPHVLLAHHQGNDRFFYHTHEGHLMEVDFPTDKNTPNIQKYLSHGAGCHFVDFVYPWCHHIVVTEGLKELIVLERYAGSEVAKMDTELEGRILCQASHPDMPLVVCVSDRGELLIASFVDPHEPRVLVKTMLQRTPLNLIRFSQSGKYAIVAEKKTGNCYCVSLQPDNKPYTVQCLLKVEERISDVVAYEVRAGLKVFVLYVDKKRYQAGQKLLFYDVPIENDLITNAAAAFDLPGVYRELLHVPGSGQSLIGSPYLTRQLRVQKLQDYKDVIFLDSFATGHQTRLANVYADRNWIVTAGFDGQVFVRDKSARRVVAVVTAHHRSDLGTMKAIANRAGDMVVCLGRDGSLVALRARRGDRKESLDSSSSDTTEALHHVAYDRYFKKKSKILSNYATLDPTTYNLLTRPSPKSTPSEKTWEERRLELQTDKESKQCAAEKSSILADLSALKSRVKKLLDENERCTDLERLPVSSFDLDTVGHDQNLKAAKDDREDVRQELEHRSNETNRVSEWIRLTFWDSQKTLGKSVFSILGTKEVANYPLALKEVDEREHLQWAQFSRESVRRIMESDGLEVWKKYKDDERRMALRNRAKIRREDERRRMDMLLEEEEREVERTDLEVEAAISGMTTHRFVEQSPSYYSQMESYGFAHTMINNRFLVHDCGRLRLHFNKIFEEVFVIKEREMSLIRERIDRIRRIDDELRTMFGLSVPNVPDNPTWHWRERPDGIVKVLNHEVTAKPYVSKSQQEILDKQAAEAERIRQLLLADDFRQRALMAMMDGVLELRWEDVIKRDVPKPRCMVETKPEDYTAEDILTVKQYEKDVQLLQEERERYKRILEADYVKVVAILQEGIDKFNARLDELFQLKMKIEAAINQMNLQYVRGSIRIFTRTKSLELDNVLKVKLTKAQQEEPTLLEQLQSFKNVHQEFVGQHDALCAREKTLQRKFRSEFSSLGKVNVELLERQYKRRPRVSLKNVSSSDLLDLGTHVVSRAVPMFLSLECVEYLKILESLDVRPISVPPIIETSHWEQFTRLRRQKIELELRIRAKQCEILEIERLIDSYETKIVNGRTKVEDLRKEIEEMRKGRTIRDLDMEIQLVLKMGQVEIALRGDRRDAENAIFVSRGEIDSANELIHEAGQSKLNALTRLMNFHRGTLQKEWEHKCLHKRLQDLEDDLHFTKTTTVTRDMQEYLKRQSRGWKDDKTRERLDEEQTTRVHRLSRILASHRSRLAEIQREISTCRRRNLRLDRQIASENVTRCEMEQQRDVIGEQRRRERGERRWSMLARRSHLIEALQDNYAEILALQTEHELLRLGRYPTIEFRRIDEGTDKGNVPRNRFTL